MPTIAQLATALAAPYAPYPDAAATIASAARLATIAVDDAVMLQRHRKHLLKLAQWYVTEADGKWRTRFRSSLVLSLAQQHIAAGEFVPGVSDVSVNHEHVYGRAAMADKMLAGEQIADTLALCIGCVVTVGEHQRLTNLPANVHGWARYQHAGVEVRDMAVPLFPAFALA